MFWASRLSLLSCFALLAFISWKGHAAEPESLGAHSLQLCAFNDNPSRQVAARLTNPPSDGPGLSPSERLPPAKIRGRSHRTPQKPPQFDLQSDVEMVGCQRSFTWKNEVLPVDSYLTLDGEGLKVAVAEVPSAVAELEAYQKNRRFAQTAAYVGSFGLSVAVLGILLRKVMHNSTGDTLRDVGVIGGVGLTVGSIAFSYSILSTNEGHLYRAVDDHNQAKPQQPIELQFSTGILF